MIDQTLHNNDNNIPNYGSIDIKSMDNDNINDNMDDYESKCCNCNKILLCYNIDYWTYKCEPWILKFLFVCSFLFSTYACINTYGDTKNRMLFSLSYTYMLHTCFLLLPFILVDARNKICKWIYKLICILIIFGYIWIYQSISFIIECLVKKCYQSDTLSRKLIFFFFVFHFFTIFIIDLIKVFLNKNIYEIIFVLFCIVCNTVIILAVNYLL